MGGGGRGGYMSELAYLTVFAVAQVHELVTDLDLVLVLHL